MAASDFFKVAGANIRRGIEAKRTDIAAIRSQMELKKNQTNKQIQDIQSKILRIKSDIASSQSDPDISHVAKQTEVADLHKQILNLQRELTNENEQTQNQIKNLESDLVGLDQLASSLEAKN